MPHCFFFPLAAGPCAAMTFFLLQNKGREPCVECAGSQQHAERGAHGVGSAAHAGCAVWGRARGVLPPSPPCSLCFCFAATREGPDAFPQAAERADRPGFPEATAGKGCAGARRCPGDWSCCRSRAGWSGMVGDSLSWLRLGKAGEAASASAGCARPGGAGWGQLLEGLPLAGAADLSVRCKITSFKLRNGAALLGRVLQLPQHHLGTP